MITSRMHVFDFSLSTLARQRPKIPSTDDFEWGPRIEPLSQSDHKKCSSWVHVPRRVHSQNRGHLNACSPTSRDQRLSVPTLRGLRSQIRMQRKAKTYMYHLSLRSKRGSKFVTCLNKLRTLRNVPLFQILNLKSTQPDEFWRMLQYSICGF